MIRQPQLHNAQSGREREKSTDKAARWGSCRGAGQTTHGATSRPQNRPHVALYNAGRGRIQWLRTASEACRVLPPEGFSDARLEALCHDLACGCHELPAARWARPRGVAVAARDCGVPVRWLGAPHLHRQVEPPPLPRLRAVAWLAVAQLTRLDIAPPHRRAAAGTLVAVAADSARGVSAVACIDGHRVPRDHILRRVGLGILAIVLGPLGSTLHGQDEGAKNEVRVPTHVAGVLICCDTHDASLSRHPQRAQDRSHTHTLGNTTTL
eukprot:COSAG01_NODE_4916_length_4629_cov_1.893157_2_plen_267_part_00